MYPRANTVGFATVVIAAIVDTVVVEVADIVVVAVVGTVVVAVVAVVVLVDIDPGGLMAGIGTNSFVSPLRQNYPS